MESGPKFDKKGICRLKDSSNKTVILERDVWEFKIKKPEREFFAYNFGKIKETVKAPDKTRPSKSNPNSQLLYKKFGDIWLRPEIKVPSRAPYICVIIHDSGKRKKIKTFYSTDRIKK